MDPRAEVRGRIGNREVPLVGLGPSCFGVAPCSPAPTVEVRRRCPNPDPSDLTHSCPALFLSPIQSQLRCGRIYLLRER